MEESKVVCWRLMAGCAKRACLLNPRLTIKICFLNRKNIWGWCVWLAVILDVDSSSWVPSFLVAPMILLHGEWPGFIGTIWPKVCSLNNISSSPIKEYHARNLHWPSIQEGILEFGETLLIIIFLLWEKQLKEHSDYSLVGRECSGVHFKPLV